MWESARGRQQAVSANGSIHTWETDLVGLEVELLELREALGAGPEGADVQLQIQIEAVQTN